MANKCKYCAVWREFTLLTAWYGEKREATKWWSRQKLCAGKNFIERHFGLSFQRSSKNHAEMPVGAHFRTLSIHESWLYLCQVGGWTNSDRSPKRETALRPDWFLVPCRRLANEKLPLLSINKYFCSAKACNK